MSVLSRNDTFSRVGIVLIALGIAANPPLLDVAFDRYGVAVQGLSSVLLVLIIELLVIAVGLFLIVRDRTKIGVEITNYGLLIGSVVLCFLLFEAYLRLFVPAPTFHPMFALYPNLNKTTITELTPGIVDTVRYTTNGWGVRGDSVPGEKDGRTYVLAVGGSTTLCRDLSDDETWPARLQSRLRAQDPNAFVFNAGIDGHSSRGHLLFMENIAPEIKPDVTIILVGINDLVRSLNRPYMEEFETGSLSYAVFAHSRLVQLVVTWAKVLINKAPVVQTEGYKNLNVAGRLRPFDDGEEIPEPDIPGYLTSLPEFEYNIRQIIARADAMNTRLLFLTQPAFYDTTAEWSRIGGFFHWAPNSRYTLSARNLATMLGIFNDRLIEICRENNTSCFDLASSIPHEQRYYYDPVHFSKVGADFVAQNVHEFMRTNGLTPPAL